MIVTIAGHSYVRDLYNNYSNSCLNDLKINSVNLNFKFIYSPGGKFSTFINNECLFDQIVESKPDILLVILGGNDLATDVELSKIKSDCSEFYNLLRQNLASTYIICSQIESRFLLRENRFRTPAADTFYFLANNFNNWLKNKSFKDRLLCIRGPGRLCNPDLYKADKIHLNPVGLNKLFDIIREVLIDTVNNKLNKNVGQNLD